MTFAWPTVLLGLLAIPLILVGYLLLQRRRARYAVRYPNLEVLASVVGQGSTVRRWLPVGFYLLALAAMVVGLARPHASIAVPRQEVSVVLVIDVSGSMNATDVEPTRMVAARRAANLFVELLPEDFPVAVIAFDDGVNVMTRPTTDREAVRRTIDNLRAEGGTAMGDAIARGLQMRPGGPSAPPPPPDQTEPDTVLLLLSDGANTTGSDPLDAADQAEELRIPVHTIALGTPEGTLDLSGGFGGRTLPVPPDEETLQLISEQTGGRFFSAPTEEDLRSIYEALSSRIGFEVERQEVTVVLAAVAVLLLVAGATLSALWSGRLP
jgi:Ca-activated chloride channel family protein